MGRYLVFDLETTIKAAHKRKANMFLKENWVVARGWKLQGDQQCSHEYYTEPNRSVLHIPEDVTMLVGQNIKFDLMWELANGNDELLKFFQRGGRIWDLQYAEYLIEGHIQDVQMISLDELAKKYGGTQKVDVVKQMWEEGINTPDIPKHILVDYLVGTEEENRNGGDIGNTELVFLKQVRIANEQDQLKMIADRMDGLLSTTYMEFYGLKVDIPEAKRRLSILKADLDAATAELKQYTDHLPFEFNWASRTHTSCLIYGGTVKYEVRDTYIDEATGELARLKAKAEHFILVDGRTTPINPDSETGLIVQARIGYATYAGGKKKGAYKTKQVDVPGELKVKYQDRFHTLPGYTVPEKEWRNATTDGAGKPTYSTSADVMDVLFKRDDTPFLKALQRKMSLDKEIGTYYLRIDPKKGPVGMLTCVMPDDHMLHHKLNHTNTITSRLSSNDPNLQNLPRGDKSEVKAMFTSRFGADGVMVEADYSQLEVVVQGVLSGDPQLCQDLRDQIDFHCKRVSAKFQSTRPEVTYEYALDWCKNEDHPDYKAGKKERTKCKIFSFQRAYGAGVSTVALETGMSQEETKELFEAEDRLYPGVVVFNAEVESIVNKSAIPFQAAAEDGSGAWKTYRMGEWWSPTRTRYRWRSHDAPEFMQKRGIKDTFSPPELKNYPVQGTGGEFVQAVLGLLIRRFIETSFYGNKAFLVNTVHDCIWVDCHRDVLDQVCADIKRIMESIPEFYNNRYGMNITVPFPVEVECGPNMNNLKHWHPGEPAWHHDNQNEAEDGILSVA